MFEETNVVSTIFTINSDEFNSSLSKVNQQMKLTQSEMKLAGSKLKEFGNDTKLLSDKQKILDTQIKNVNDKMKIYSDNIQKNTERMNSNKAELELLGQKKNDLNKKLKDSIKLFGEESDEAKKLKEELNKTNDEYKKKEQQLKNNINAINKNSVELNKNKSQLVDLQGELRKTNENISKNSNSFIKYSEAMQATSEKMKSAGQKIGDVGGKIMSLSAPLLAGGVAIGKFSMDFEKSIAKVSTLIDTSVVDINTFKSSIIQLSDTSGISVNDLTESLYEALSAGVSTADAMDFLTKSTKLAKSGFADTTQTIDLLTSILNSYGLEVSEVSRISDILIQTQNYGKTTIQELSQYMGKLIPTAKEAGVNIEQLGSAYAILTSKGIQTAESTTYLNSMMNELSKSGTKVDDVLKKVTGKGFKDLTKEGKTLGEILNIINDYAGKSGLALNDMFGSVEGAKAAMTLANNSGKDFNEMLKNMTNSAGSTEEAFNKISNTTGEKFTKSINKFKNSFLEAGDKLAPTIDLLSDGISNIADKLGQMDAQTIVNIIKMGAFGTVLGGTMKIVGGFTTGLGSIIGGLGKLTGALGTATTATATVGTTASVAGGVGGLGALAGGLGSVLATVAPFAIGAGAIATAGYGIYKVMSKEVVPSVDLFADRLVVCGKKVGEFGEVNEYTTVKISEQTKKQVQAYVDMDNGVTSTLEGLYINSTAITDEIKNSTIAKFDEMSSKVVEGYRTQKDSAIQETTELFSSTKNITETEQTELLNSISQYYKDQETTVNNAETQIKGILDRASSEHRELTKEEYETVTMWREKMKEKAISALSENEIEAKVILQRMKDYDGRITAEQASEHIKKLNESKNKAVATANEEYEKRIALIERMKSEGIIKSQEQADKMIAEAKRQRDGIVENAEKTRMDAIEKMRQMNTDLETQVDTSTGKILTWWDKLKRWWSGWQPESKSFEYTITARQGQSSPVTGEVERGYYTGTSSVSESGVYKVNELGWELFDSNNNLQSISYNTAYLPSGTQVTNHLTSTQQMRRDISSEVSRQIAGNSNKLALLIGEEVGKQLKTNDITTSYNISKLEVVTQIDNNSGVDQLLDSLNQLPLLAMMRR